VTGTIGKDRPVGVLLGGKSAERDVSLQSGKTVADALESLAYPVRRVDPADADWIAQLDGVSCAFNALHGPGGEDGSMQGALEAGRAWVWQPVVLKYWLPTPIGRVWWIASARCSSSLRVKVPVSA
jgi:D-alanine-D-alanine ligase-like ATP-grasp enzyme